MPRLKYKDPVTGLWTSIPAIRGDVHGKQGGLKMCLVSSRYFILVQVLQGFASF